MAWNERRPPATSESLEERRRSIVAAQEATNLPEFQFRVDADPAMGKWIVEQVSRMDAAIRDIDEVLFDQAAGAWQKAAHRVNEIIAEEYRVAHPDVELWDLRYFKWMTRVTFIKFDSPFGEFYLVPRKPRVQPKTMYWYTADEMIDMLHPQVAHTIKTFGVLPDKRAVPKLKPGEQIIHVDATGDQFEIWCETPGGARRAGKGIR